MALAAALGVDRSTASRWIRSGKFGAWWANPDGAPRVSAGQVQAWADRRTRGGPAPVFFFKEETTTKRRGSKVERSEVSGT